MRLIVGLGNPGERYAKTRHNVGFMVLDVLVQKLQNSKTPNFQTNKKLKSQISKFNDLILAKPLTFMNESGEAIKSLTTFYHLLSTNLWVIHDDLDLPLGHYKIQKGKGPREHGGLLSIYEKLGTKNFWHVRIGIENRDQSLEVGRKISGEKYVLQEFTEEELKILDKVIEELIGNLSKRLKF